MHGSDSSIGCCFRINPPQKLQVTAGDQKALLNWEAPEILGLTHTGFKVYKEGIETYYNRTGRKCSLLYGC